MTMPSLLGAMHPGAYRILVLVALLAVVADADAKGRRGGGSRSSSSSASSKSESSGNTIHLRSSSSSSSSNGSSQSVPSTGGPTASGESTRSEPELTPEEAARRAALLEAYERKQAEEAAARRASIEKAEADRMAAEQAAAARKAAEDKAKADKLAADLQKKQLDQAAIVSDVDRVLLRAKGDYPVLNTPEGAPLLARIMARQKELAADGLYPSIAMVQAIADHDSLLRPVGRYQPPATQAAQATQPGQAGGCRWVTPTQWGCK
jgi:hypothetical protein